MNHLNWYGRLSNSALKPRPRFCGHRGKGKFHLNISGSLSTDKEFAKKLQLIKSCPSELHIQEIVDDLVSTIWANLLMDHCSYGEKNVYSNVPSSKNNSFLNRITLHALCHQGKFKTDTRHWLVGRRAHAPAICDKTIVGRVVGDGAMFAPCVERFAA